FGEYPGFLVDGAEESAVLLDRLRRAEHQEPVRLQRIVEDGNHPLLKRKAEVDQHVPAGQEVEPREGRILDDVLPREDAEVADGLGNLPGTLLQPDEEAPPPLRRNIAHHTAFVDPRPRLIDRAIADIGAEELKLAAVP